MEHTPPYHPLLDGNVSSTFCHVQRALFCPNFLREKWYTGRAASWARITHGKCGPYKDQRQAYDCAWCIVHHSPTPDTTQTPSRSRMDTQTVAWSLNATMRKRNEPPTHAAIRIPVSQSKMWMPTCRTSPFLCSSQKEQHEPCDRGPVRSPRRESDGSERRPWGAGNSLFRDVCGVTQVGWLSRITDSCVRVWSTLPYLCYIPISLNEQVGCIDAIQCCVTILNEIISSTWTSLELSSQHLKGKISKII